MLAKPQAAKASHFSGIVAAVFVALTLFLSAENAEAATCKGTPLNPITDVCWHCMFPFRVGGFQFGRGADSAPGKIDPVMCECFTSGQYDHTAGNAWGLSTAFWEHARIIETVKEPWCMPALGTSLGGGTEGLNKLLAGSNKTAHASSTESDYANQQVHYYYFPVWQLLNLFVDFPCIEKKPFDVAYMTEVDPMWNDDALSFILNPEALLFGNPITQLACMADTVAATAGAPLDPLFWCQGAWGSSYPLNGSSTVTNPTALNASMASRMLYKLGREGLLWDTAVDNCMPEGVPTPIWNKGHYRLQIARPRRGNDCVPIGRPDMLWGSAKNPAWGAGRNSPDNFMWILTKARRCCVNYYQMIRGN